MTATRWYGTSVTLEEMRLALGRALGIEFEPRESSYLGGGYYIYKRPNIQMKLFVNLDVTDAEPGVLLEPNSPTVLLVESAEPLSSKIREGLSRIPALRETYKARLG